MNPAEFLAAPGDLLEGQAFLINKQDTWRWLDPPQPQSYVKLALYQTNYRRPTQHIVRTYVNSPYTPKSAYDGACNLLEPA